MADSPTNPFTPIRDKDGNVTGMMDQTTAEHFTSQAPAPTQASLDALLATVTRVRIVPVSNLFAGTTEKKFLLDTSDRESLASFRACFAIIEDPDTFGHCMCFGDPHIELYAGEQLVATLGYHHGFSIRWDVWKYDACLSEPDCLLDWMSAHGVNGPRQEVEKAKRQSEEHGRNIELWFRATPECLRPFWDKTDHTYDQQVHREMLEALKRAIPAESDQILALLGWFGSGAGPWSGFPSYEAIVNMLLLSYPTSLIVTALTMPEAGEVQWLGAARYFESWDFGKAKKEDRELLTPTLKARLLEAARSSGIPDNIKRATHAFRP